MKKILITGSGSYIGESFKGVITSVTSFGFFVELDNTCEGLVPIGSLDGYFDFDERSFTLSNGVEKYSLGMEVEVVIEDVDIITRKTDMHLLSSEERLPRRRI